MRKKFGDYYLGLDMGTESVGWAVTDLDYNLLKFHRKQMWGIHLFEEASTAMERRTFRSGRRRLGRRHQRLKLLEEIFSEEISRVDYAFFQRLKESKFYPEDKNIRDSNGMKRKEQYSLFADKKYTDKEYHEEFPTIYHLRKALIEGKQTYDIRLYYLAIHHILKHRGHFLFEGQNMQTISSFSNVFHELKEMLYDEYGITFICDSEDEVSEVIRDRTLGIQKKTTALNKQFHIASGNSMEKHIIKLLAGGTVKLKDLYQDVSLDELEVKQICFGNGKYDEDILKLQEELPERTYLIEKLKALYDWGVLANIIGEESYLSFAKVKIYEKHKKDLMLLKKVLRGKSCFTEKDYKAVFTDLDVKNANYAIYVGKNSNHGKQKPKDKRGSFLQEDLCKFVKKYLERIPEEERDDTVTYLLEEAEANTLLPKQVSKDNGVIPYQLHLLELDDILQNLKRDYPAFAVTDETGLNSCEKIRKLFTFRIPYYVGPLNDAHADKEGDTKGNCWIVKKSKEKILPWNFDEIVDKDASAERFIRRMTNKCTYLLGEDVLPKDSLLYSRFMVWNELNNVKIDQEDIDVDLKQKIFKEVFQDEEIKGKVTIKKLEDYLVREGIFERGESHEITGIDGEFKSKLTSYRDMKKIFDNEVHTETEMIEDIIISIVLFGEDRELLKRRLEQRYVKTGKMTQEQLKKVLKKKYTAWGRLSAKFLNQLEGADKETGEKGTILYMLENTNKNLMQLLSENYTFLEEVENYNAIQNGEQQTINYDMVDELYVSPAVKRMIWQSLGIIKEVTKIMGHEPKRVFVEMAREKTQDGRKDSRKAQLLQLYKNCKEEERDWEEEIEGYSESDFRSTKRFLYYTQMGRCMYCGKSIDLHELMKMDTYDRDHIYPQSKTKDDSLDNLVLVCKDHNAKKSDVYPLSSEIQSDMKSHWKLLLDRNLITKEKYSRLVRKDGFQPEELAGFISRQLVETRQSTKAVAEILNKVFDKTEVVYVKANNVSNFRRDYEFIKVREINDYHHAQDAYLNIVVGNVYHTKFTKSPLNFVKNVAPREYSLNRMYDFDVERDGVIAWKRGKAGTISTVTEVMEQDLSKPGRIQFTRYASETKGALFDLQPVKKGKGQAPLKGSDSRLSIEKYGGYNKVAGAYFMLVESDGKKGKIRSLEYVPIYLAKQFEADDEVKMKYCVEELKLNNPKILLPKIKINSLLVIDGYPVHLSGRTGPQIIFKNAVQLCLEKNDVKYLKRIVKYVNRNAVRANKKELLPIAPRDNITKEENLKLYEVLLDKHANLIYKKRAASQVSKLQVGREIFIKLPLEEQALTLYEILHLFQCRPITANLKQIGGSGEAGKFQLSKELQNRKSVKLIHQSPTGLFEKEIDLLRL